MRWQEVLPNFHPLLEDVLEKMTVYRFQKETGRDKKTTDSWQKGQIPTQPEHVASLIRTALKHGMDVSRHQSFKPIYDFSSMLTYEQKRNAGPPDLEWLAKDFGALPEFRCRLGDLIIDSPLGLASSPLTGDDRWVTLQLNLGYGLITMKTCRTGQKDALIAPHVAFVLDPPVLSNYDPANPPTILVTCDPTKRTDEISNIVNSIGVGSPHAAEWQASYQRIKSHPRGGLVGISILGEGSTDESLMKDLECALRLASEVRPPFVEVNVSCPNLAKAVDIYNFPDLLLKVCKTSCQILHPKGILMVLKLPWLAEEKLHEILKLVGNLVDAISLRNTIRVRPVVKERDEEFVPVFPGREYGGLSGPCTLPLTLAMVEHANRVREILAQKFAIIAVGGVATHADVAELMNAGADVVQACTGPMFDPLLAWKVRFHFSKTAPKLKKGREETKGMYAPELLLPRDEVESSSFRNADAAANEIARRYPARALPYHRFRDGWNGWMRGRSDRTLGAAQRVAGTRSMADWIKEFLG